MLFPNRSLLLLVIFTDLFDTATDTMALSSLLFALAALVAPAARAMPAPNLFFNWTFTDMDAVITYTPDNAGTGTPLWNTSYANSPWTNYAPGQTGSGMSQHSAVATNTQNPGVAFNFLGTGYALLGQISLPSNGALSVTQDGQQQSANAVSNTILSMGTGDYRYHKIQVALVDTANQPTARPSVSVTGLTVQYGFYSQA